MVPLLQAGVTQGMWAACNRDKEDLKCVSVTVLASQLSYVTRRRSIHLVRGLEAEQISDTVPHAPDPLPSFSFPLFSRGLHPGAGSKDVAAVSHKYLRGIFLFP